MAANGKTLEYLIKEGLVRVSAENTDYVIIKSFTNARGTQSTASQTSEYAVKLSDLLGALEESADLTAHINDATDAHDASAVSYNPAVSGLTAVNTQAAIDELVVDLANARPYKVYTATVTQSSTNAPVSVVLDNTFGAVPTWSYVKVGIYHLAFPAGTFTNQDKVWIYSDTRGGEFAISTGATVISDTTISFTIQDISGGLDDAMFKAPIEIRYYN